MKAGKWKTEDGQHVIVHSELMDGRWIGEDEDGMILQWSADGQFLSVLAPINTVSAGLTLEMLEEMDNSIFIGVDEDGAEVVEEDTVEYDDVFQVEWDGRLLVVNCRQAERVDVCGKHLLIIGEKGNVVLSGRFIGVGNVDVAFLQDGEKALYNDGELFPRNLTDQQIYENFGGEDYSLS